MMPRAHVIRLVGLLALMIGTSSFVATVSAQDASCADYTSQSAAQFALDINPGLASSLDPDGNGVACDDGANTGPVETAVPGRTGSDLQLPTTVAETPTPPSAQPTATVAAVDQQPTDTIPTATPPGTTQQTTTGVLDGRLGSNVTAFATIHGAPLDENPSENNASVIGRSYTPPETANDLFVIYFDDQAAIILLAAELPWTGTEAAAVIGDFLPADVTQLPPNSETLADDSILIPIFSDDLAAGVSADMMTNAGLPGVPGDMYLLLVTDGGDRATEIEIGIGNGDNVKEDVNESTTTDPTPVQGTTDPTPVQGTTNTVPPTPTQATTTNTTTPDAATFLQETRAEVDRIQGEIDELRTIITAGTYTDAEIDRLSDIIVSWMVPETSLPTAPAEYSDIANQMQQVRDDLAFVGQSLFLAVGTGDTTGIEEAGTVLNTIETNLDALDQQLTDLGY